MRDNATSCEHAVRRLIRRDGEEQLIPMRRFDSHVAYCLHPDEHGWLDVNEAQQLRVLMDAYNTPGCQRESDPRYRSPSLSLASASSKTRSGLPWAASRLS